MANSANQTKGELAPRNEIEVLAQDRAERVLNAARKGDVIAGEVYSNDVRVGPLIAPQGYLGRSRLGPWVEQTVPPHNPAPGSNNPDNPFSPHKDELGRAHGRSAWRFVDGTCERPDWGEMDPCKPVPLRDPVLYGLSRPGTPSEVPLRNALLGEDSNSLPLPDGAFAIGSQGSQGSGGSGGAPGDQNRSCTLGTYSGYHAPYMMSVKRNNSRSAQIQALTIGSRWSGKDIWREPTGDFRWSNDLQEYLDVKSGTSSAPQGASPDLFPRAFAGIAPDEETLEASTGALSLLGGWSRSRRGLSPWFGFRGGMTAARSDFWRPHVQAQVSAKGDRLASTTQLYGGRSPWFDNLHRQRGATTRGLNALDDARAGDGPEFSHSFGNSGNSQRVARLWHEDPTLGLAPETSASPLNLNVTLDNRRRQLESDLLLRGPSYRGSQPSDGSFNVLPASTNPWREILPSREALSVYFDTLEGDPDYLFNDASRIPESGALTGVRFVHSPSHEIAAFADAQTARFD